MGGPATGPHPTDRGKPGSKHRVISDRQGRPLAAAVTGATRPDQTVLEPLVERIAPIKRRRGIQARIARKGGESATKLGRHRWVVERTLAWRHRFRRLTIRYERDEAMHQALPDLGCALICLNFLRGP